MYCVYKHTVPNGKVYIGITSVNPLTRWSNGHGYKDNKGFWKDIILYGWLNIRHEILYDGLTEHEARDTEAKLICEYQSYKKKYGYNRDAGYIYGYIEKPEYKDSRVRVNREEYLSHCNSDEYRKSCRPNTNKQIDVFDSFNNLVASYESIRETARKLNVDKKNITDCLKGKQKTCRGYTFKVRPHINSEAV
jgi:hypothetical protein